MITETKKKKLRRKCTQNQSPARPARHHKTVNTSSIDNSKMAHKTRPNQARVQLPQIFLKKNTNQI